VPRFERVVTPPSGGTPTLRLGESGGLAGSTGCNVLKSTYAADGQSLSFGPIGTTRKYCRAAWDTERAFLSVLAKVHGYAVDGNTLTLSGGNGKTLAEFEATGR
jgi:heat shock protein HslJ